MAYLNPSGYTTSSMPWKTATVAFLILSVSFVLVVKNNSSDRSVNMKTQNSSDLCCFRPCLGALQVHFCLTQPEHLRFGAIKPTLTRAYGYQSKNFQWEKMNSGELHRKMCHIKVCLISNSVTYDTNSRFIFIVRFVPTIIPRYTKMFLALGSERYIDLVTYLPGSALKLTRNIYYDENETVIGDFHNSLLHAFFQLWTLETMDVPGRSK